MKRKRDMTRSRDDHAQTLSAVSGAVMLIGIGVLFLVDSIPFWPWILVVVALATLPRTALTAGVFGAALAALWLIGLALLFAFEVFWPGILLLVGATIALRALLPLLGFAEREP